MENSLHPEVLQTLTDRGFTPQEVITLRERMLYSVASLQVRISALTAQIDALTVQRSELQVELTNASVTVGKLLADPAQPA